MTNIDFINSVVKEQNKGYKESRRGKSKISPLHSTMNNLILENLPNNFEGAGIGLPIDKELTIQNSCGISWKPDGFFFRTVTDPNCIAVKGGAIDYKSPLSNLLQNNQNLLKTIAGEATRTRPYGNSMACFVMLPDRVPYFNRNGVVQRIEKVSQTTVKEWEKYANTPKGNDGSCDIVGLCVYRLIDFDFDNIFTEEDYKNALEKFNGEIKFVNYKVESNENFVFNDPMKFAHEYAKIIENKFSYSGKQKTLAELFLETPLDEQEKYLVEHGKLSFIPRYVYA